MYDGDGNRVLGVVNGVTSVYVGDHYELEIDGAVQTTRLYYSASGQRVAVRTNGTLTYLLGDHLGSTSLAVTANGALASEQRYAAFGQTRYAMGDLPTVQSNPTRLIRGPWCVTAASARANPRPYSGFSAP